MEIFLIFVKSDISSLPFISWNKFEQLFIYVTYTNLIPKMAFPSALYK